MNLCGIYESICNKFNEFPHAVNDYDIYCHIHNIITEHESEFSLTETQHHGDKVDGVMVQFREVITRDGIVCITEIFGIDYENYQQLGIESYDELIAIKE
ncbi:hypothetical protein N9137_00985 [Pseudomonadales bacterium]|nr:hypothetical protein [Pseudomonadales bacterium]